METTLEQHQQAIAELINKTITDYTEKNNLTAQFGIAYPDLWKVMMRDNPILAQNPPQLALQVEHKES